MATNLRRYLFELRDRDPEIVTLEKQGVNPFTLKPMTIKAKQHRGWPPERRDSVNALLDAHGAQADDDGHHLVELPGGEKIGINFGHEEAGGEWSEVSLVCEEPTEAAADFLIAVSRAANMVLFPDPDEGAPVAVIDRPIDPKGSKRWPKAFVVRSSGDLIAWLGRVGFHEPD